MGSSWQFHPGLLWLDTLMQHLCQRSACDAENPQLEAKQHFLVSVQAHCYRPVFSQMPFVGHLLLCKDLQECQTAT